MSAWKPGTVAMVTWEEPSGRSTIESTERAEFTGAAWVWVGGMIQPEWVAFARPLVVIDPEDAEAVERLLKAYHAQYPMDRPSDTDAMHARNLAAALREFANPMPPKPDEPTGWLAVVEDASGDRWVRDAHDRAGVGAWWNHSCAARDYVGGELRAAYAEIDAVTVISEGVTP